MQRLDAVCNTGWSRAAWALGFMPMRHLEWCQSCTPVPDGGRTSVRQWFETLGVRAGDGTKQRTVAASSKRRLDMRIPPGLPC